MGGNGLVSWVMTILSSLFGLVLAARGFGHWAKKEWGALVTHLIGASVVAFTIYSPAQAVAILKTIGTQIASVFTG